MLRFIIDGPDNSGKTFAAKKLVEMLEKEFNKDSSNVIKVDTLFFPTKRFRESDTWKKMSKDPRDWTKEYIENWVEETLYDMFTAVKDERVLISDVIIEDRSIMSTIVYQFAMHIMHLVTTENILLDDFLCENNVRLNKKTLKKFVKWVSFVSSKYENTRKRELKDERIEEVYFFLMQNIQFSSNAIERNVSDTDDIFEKMAPLVNILYKELLLLHYVGNTHLNFRKIIINTNIINEIFSNKALENGKDEKKFKNLIPSTKDVESASKNIKNIYEYLKYKLENHKYYKES